MKILIPIMTLFLASCGVHNHRYDANQDTYYEDDYYAYDNYDPYYGYGSSEYSSTGDGVYYNNYNYYPDRWGVTYSNVNYSPFRYPRVGFYFSTANNCGYSYWSNWCAPGWGSSYYGSGFYASNWWPSYGFGLSYSSYYYDNYFWYNHWRNRNYYHNRPTQHGYYSARNEASRLVNGRYYSRYKNNSPGRNNNQRNNNQRNSNYRSNPRPVNRGRSTGNRVINRSSGNRANRNNKPTQRSQQQSAALNPNGANYRQATSRQNSSREVVTGRSETGNLQNNIQRNYAERNLPNNRYQKPALVASEVPRQRVRQPNNTYQKPQQPAAVRVKPMNSQSPVYHNNTRPSAVVRQPVVQGTYNQRLNLNRSVPANSAYNNNRVNQSRPQTQTRPAQSVPSPTVKPVSKPQRAERSRNRVKNSDSKSNHGQSGRSNNRHKQR